MTAKATGRRMLTIAEICALYNISRTTIYRRIKDGTLPAQRLGARSIRIDPRDARDAFEAYQDAAA